jgi:hypothetical protein
MGTDSLADELPSLALHDGVIVNRDLSLAAGWSIQLPNTMLAGDKMRAALTVVFRSILNSLPKNYEWQLRWVQHGRVKELDEVFSRRPKPSGLAGEIVAETEGVNRRLLAGNAISWKECQLFLVRKPLKAELLPEAGIKRSKFRQFVDEAKVIVRGLMPGSAIADAQANAEIFAGMLADLRNMLDTFEPALRGAGLYPARMTNAACMRVLYEWANKERYEMGGTPADYPATRCVPLCELYALTEFDPEDLPPGIFRMGNSYQAILTLDLPPGDLGLGVWENIIYSGLTRMDVTTWGAPNDKTVRLRNLNRLLTGLKSQGDAPEKRQQRLDLERELEELGGNTDNLWKFFATFRVWGKSPDEAMTAANQLIVACEGSGRIGLIHERKNLWTFLRSTCPGWTGDQDKYRALDLTTRQVARLLPINAQPSFLRLSPDAIGALFSTVSSTSGLLNIDPHERSIYAAPHFLISAGTGQGKSVLASSLILELMGSDGRAVMLDRGGSFDGLAAAMGTQPIKLTTKNRDITLNPLFVAEGKLPDPDELGGILMLLECMVMSSAQQEGRLPGELGRTLREVLQRLYEARPGIERTLGELRDSLAETESGRWLASNLSPWCAGGEYGVMFDGPNNIALGGRLTVIDLGQDVRGANQALTNVLTMLVISIVSQLMSHGGVRRKYVIFDEAGLLMKNKAQAEFLDYAYRTFRKTGTGVGALTQKAMDLAGLFSYAPLKFFLRQDDLEDTRQAAKAAGLPEETVSFIRDLETRPGEFADFVVIQETQVGTLSHLCRNYVTPLKYAMITSDKEDTVAIETLMREQKVGRDGAMRLFAKQFPRGVAYARTHPSQPNLNAA